MTTSQDFFEQERAVDMEGDLSAEINHIQTEAEQQFPLPVIDTNTISPGEDMIQVMAGDKPEKFNITSFSIAQQMIAAIKDGNVNPLDFAVKKKLISDAFDLTMKDSEVKKIMVEEVEKYGKEGATALGAKITVQTKSTYQYNADPKWKELADSIKDTEDKMKAQEEKIKAAVKNNGSIVDNDSGEMIASIVPVKTTESIAVSFNKKK